MRIGAELEEQRREFMKESEMYTREFAANVVPTPDGYYKLDLESLKYEVLTLHLSPGF